MAIGPKGPRKHEGVEKIPMKEQKEHKREVINPFKDALDRARAAMVAKSPKRDRVEGAVEVYKRKAPTLDRNEIDKMKQLIHKRKGGHA